MNLQHKECDVLVVGGGAAGISAAIAAGRKGLRVILLEKYGFLGGLATAGMVGTICGLYLRGGNRPKFVENCFAVEWASRLMESSKSVPRQLAGGLWVLPYEPWQFTLLADEIVTECKGIDIIFHAVVSGATVVKGTISSVAVMGWDRLLVIRPKAVVDCTGEATLIRLAGGEDTGKDEEQSPAVVFDMLVQMDFPEIQTRLVVLRRIAEALERGRFPDECRGVSLVPVISESRGVLRFKVSLAWPSDEPDQEISKMEMLARRVISSLDNFLRENFASMHKAELHFPAQIGIRSGWRAVGVSRLTTDDVLSCRKTDMSGPWGTWPMEIWCGGSRPKITYMPAGDFYTISRSCQIAKNLQNAFMGGRCISATSQAIGSARVIGTALQTGFAAGGYAAEIAM